MCRRCDGIKISQLKNESELNAKLNVQVKEKMEKLKKMIEILNQSSEKLESITKTLNVTNIEGLNYHLSESKKNLLSLKGGLTSLYSSFENEAKSYESLSVSKKSESDHLLSTDVCDRCRQFLGKLF